MLKRTIVAGLSTLLALDVACAADLRGALTTDEPSCKATPASPVFAGVIKANPSPACVTVPGVGDIYVGGALTAYGYAQSNPFPREFADPLGVPPDRAARVDFTNLQGWVQKVDGTFQFFIQGGGYAIPQLGLPNYGSIDQTRLSFSPLPVAYGKIQFNEKWSLQAGRMPTLIGSEAPFTFQNLNINRGLLFVQENLINQGAQVNWSDGPWSASVAGTDGFYSGDLTWFTGNVAYKIDDASTVGVNGGLNLGRQNVFARSPRYQFATPPFQQNSGIFNLNYTYATGPWIVTPYVQVTNVECDARAGILTGASTYGGALLASYAFTANFALAGRVEYEEQTGVRGSGTTSLLYGAGSNAFSATITPTFTFDRTFIRLEYARVALGGITRGSLADGTLGTGFGRSGNRNAQDRYVVETGLAF